jgi:hypothetical protein
MKENTLVRLFKRLLAATELVDFCDAPVLKDLKIAEKNQPF